MDTSHPIPTSTGMFLTREAIAAGYDKYAIARHVKAKEWTRLRHGAYCLTAQWDELDEKGRRGLVAEAVYRCARTHVALSHLSALDRLGVPYWDLDDGLTHVTRTDGKAGRKEAGVDQHRGSVVAEDLTVVDGLWVTNGTRTAIDCMTLTDVEHGLVVTNGLLRAGETTLELVQRRVETMHRRPDTLQISIVLRLADGRSESIGEDRTLFLLWMAGLPMPELQYPIRDRSGRVVARVDFAWPELGVFLEFDGKVKYEALLREGESPADVVVREKRREEMICGLTGWRCIRITWADLMHPERTIARIRAVLAGQPWAA